jgi:hypothetical protein
MSCAAQKHDPWKKSQLMEPAVLAAALKLPPRSQPLIIDVGPAGVIKNARETGPVHEQKGMQKFTELLKDVPRSREVVIYCGCCPFAKCPNVRPAFQALLDMGFSSPRLLDLSHNLKADWIDKGYPLENH